MHSPHQHSKEMCHVCTSIMEGPVEDGEEASEPYSSKSSISLASYSYKYGSKDTSYQADISEDSSKISSTQELPVKLADIEYENTGKKRTLVWNHKHLNNPVVHDKYIGGKIRNVESKVPKTKGCEHKLFRKHTCCNTCYECKLCKEKFLKKTDKSDGFNLKNNSDLSDCSKCGKITVKPNKKYVDCLIE